MQSSREPVHRCFYALTFSEVVNRAIADLITSLKSHDQGVVRWTPLSNLHLTLRFLGELPQREFGQARQVMKEARLPSPFTLQFGGIDLFPSLRKPRVIVLDLSQQTDPASHDAFHSLQSLTESFAQALGLEPEKRAFRPHLTIGRIRRGESLSASLRERLTSVAVDIPEAGIDRLLLMESKLSQKGAEYRIVERCQL